MGHWPGYVKGSSGSSYAPCSTCAANPKPDQFRIVRIESRGDTHLMEVKYTNCTNYEGVKYMIVTLPPLELVNLRRLDPHFSKNGNIKVRFEPTPEGWALGMMVLEAMK